DERRFWSKVDTENGPLLPGMETPCWVWFGHRGKWGHGRVWFHPCRGWPASWVAWLLHYGDIPDGLDCLHGFDYPSCVNPSHLFLGTQADNVADMQAKGRMVNPVGETNGKARLTDEQVIEVRRRYRYGSARNGGKALAQEFGIAISTL